MDIAGFAFSIHNQQMRVHLRVHSTQNHSIVRTGDIDDPAQMYD